MQVGVDAILKNLHVPSNIIAKVNAEAEYPAGTCTRETSYDP